jgi:predicted Ser/Thr protein kinase
MKLRMTRYSMEISPENSTDEAFFEEVIGLKGKDSTAVARRVNASGLSRWAYLEIRKPEEATPKIIDFDEEDLLRIKIASLEKQLAEYNRTEQVISAAGLLDKEKFDKAREIVRGFE